MQNSAGNLIKVWFPRIAVWNPGYSVRKQRAVWQTNATSPLGPRLHHSPSGDSLARWPLAQITVPPAEPPSQAKTSEVETFSLLLAKSIIDCQRGGFHSKLSSPACCYRQISIVSLSQLHKWVCLVQALLPYLQHCFLPFNFPFSSDANFLPKVLFSRV